MEIREVMTESVVTAAADTAIRRIAEIMRERNVGSVVLLDEEGEAVAFITDRDLAVSVLADGHGGDANASDHASSPVVTVGTWAFAHSFPLGVNIRPRFATITSP